jgi:hypothetical protein
MANDQKVAVERPGYPFNHEWHVCINRFHDATKAIGTDRWRKWMYEAKAMADEVPRLAMLFHAEREGKLPQIHQQCSHSAPEPIPQNELTCCLGVKCKACPELLALDSMQRVTPEQIDQAKAWTCAAHIVSQGGDPANEGYVLTTGDTMYWSRVYANLAASDEDPAP